MSDDLNVTTYKVDLRSEVFRKDFYIDKFTEAMLQTGEVSVEYIKSKILEELTKALNNFKVDTLSKSYVFSARFEEVIWFEFNGVCITGYARTYISCLNGRPIPYNTDFAEVKVKGSIKKPVWR